MSTSKKGTLIIAGSGIAAIGHMTLETLSHIQAADKVYYAVTDRATEAFILDKSKAPDVCTDLTIYYGKDKLRYETYVQMCEVMLRDVRAGLDVLGIFYGHPGVFVSPTHRAIAIAQDEGYVAKMLPGVSAEDYMFSDLGFDPAVHGCMSQEATALLLTGTKLDPTVHNIIWQVGSVGVTTMVFNNQGFHLLVDRLEEDFGAEHCIVHYIGAVLPQSASVMDKFKISDLRKEEVVRQINACSTFYVPPRAARSFDSDIRQQLGLPEQISNVYPRSKWLGADYPAPNMPAYGQFEQYAISRIDGHTVEDDHKYLYASPAMRQFMADIALQPQLRNRYRKDPASVVDGIPGMSAEEKYALTIHNPSAVFRVMSRTKDELATNKQITMEEIADAAYPNGILAGLCFPPLLIIIITL